MAKDTGEPTAEYASCSERTCKKRATPVSALPAQRDGKAMNQVDFKMDHAQGVTSGLSSQTKKPKKRNRERKPEPKCNCASSKNHIPDKDSKETVGKR